MPLELEYANIHHLFRCLGSDVGPRHRRGERVRARKSGTGAGAHRAQCQGNAARLLGEPGVTPRLRWPASIGSVACPQRRLPAPCRHVWPHEAAAPPTLVFWPRFLASLCPGYLPGPFFRRVKLAGGVKPGPSRRRRPTCSGLPDPCAAAETWCWRTKACRIFTRSTNRTDCPRDRCR